MPNLDKTDAAVDLNTPLKTALPASSGQLMVPPANPPGTTASGRSKWLVWIAVATVLFASGALWYSQPWVTKGREVAVETVTPGALMRVLAVNGRIAPLHQVDVKATVGGTLLSVSVQEGDVVRLGDQLARVDPVKQQAAVRQAMAGLDASLVAQAQAVASYSRAVALGSNIARKALDDARSGQQSTDQEVVRLTALLDQAQIDLGKYTLVAPIAGTILTRDAEVGQVIDTVTPLYTLADLSQLVVETDVDEAYATQVKSGLPAVLQIKGETAKRAGRVSFVAPQVTAATGGLAVKITFDQPVTVPVGLTVTANIIVDKETAAISIPRAAVIFDAAGSAVFVAKAGHALRRTISVVEWPADRLQVTAGLVASEAVITDATGLTDGMAITVPKAP